MKLAKYHSTMKDKVKYLRTVNIYTSDDRRQLIEEEEKQDYFRIIPRPRALIFALLISAATWYGSSYLKVNPLNILPVSAALCCYYNLKDRHPKHSISNLFEKVKQTSRLQKISLRRGFTNNPKYDDYGLDKLLEQTP